MSARSPDAERSHTTDAERSHTTDHVRSHTTDHVRSHTTDHVRSHTTDAGSAERPSTAALQTDGGQTRTPFTDSPVVTTTVRLLAPFVLTLGLFTLFHGTSSVGGGFQGGVVAAAMVITVAFALGLSPTADWIDARALGALVASGVVVFGVVALAGVAFGGAFLQLDVLPIPKATVYATEAIEVGIGATVAAVIVVLFVRIGEGYTESTRTPSVDDDAAEPPESIVPESVAAVGSAADPEEARDE